ncbi:MAG: hypothetical protein H6Q13_3527, partial [Bacteroidetes bacterium]|nr:hypothetical protein [Bacteroidota bacterium]
TGSKAISIGAFDSNILKGVFSTTGSYNGYNLQLDDAALTLTGATVGAASYYDNYNFLQLNGFSTLAYDSSIQTDYGSRYTVGYQGILTGSYTAQAPGSTASVSLCSALYYDNRNRVIQSASTNHLGGKDTECVFYTFTGQPLRKKHIHTATGKATQTEFYSYAYDHAGRLLTTKHKLNTGTEVTLTENTYDELGRLKTNKKNNQANLNTTYTYNVRSWMKSSSSPLFSQTLYYNDSYGNNTPRYNGNISAMSWTTSGDKTRGYNFSYDNLSRLTTAGYLEGGVANTSYGTSYAYDKHGNMTNLVRNGRTGTSTFGTIDNLSMSYAGNQLIKADDAGTNVTLSASMDFKNNSTAAKEYFYDLNGNLTQDLNKGITGITYNLLNLPQSVAISNTLGQATNTYTYAADGRRLRAIIGSKQTDYVGNVIYEGGILKRILVDGGYIEGGVYYFYLTDHLGNNRVVANASGGIVQTNHYYPFGMPFAEGVTSSGQPYKYNGKELDMERGLNLYDYSARLMDPVLARFSTMDPKSEKCYNWSPYLYCKNNPIKYIDPDGKREWPINETYNGYSRRHENNFGAARPNGRTHKGVDINYAGAGNKDRGAPIVATHDGTVTRVAIIGRGDKDAGGNRVQITSMDGNVSTYYMHLDAINSGIQVGAEVTEGQQLGTMGGSGKGESEKYVSHLHYEIIIDGVKVNPTTSKTDLIDPQQIITPINGGTLPEVVVEGQKPSPTIPKPVIEPLPQIDRLDMPLN